MILNNAILKKRIGIKVKKVCKQVTKVWKQVEDGMELNGCYRMKVNSKAFAIPV